jgi:osmoprotectant transport system substrate-binding protein
MQAGRRAARPLVRRPAAALALAAAGLLAGCGAASTSSRSRSRTSTSTTTTVATQPALPGAGRPPVTIGDKNFTEQFVLGELYAQALRAQGYSVVLNANIGATEVTLRALQTGTLDMYPEYLGTWNGAVAGYRTQFPSPGTAYAAGQSYALTHGFQLLDPTPFSDTPALAVNFNYGAQYGLAAIGDLRTVASTLTMGAPAQFEQSADGLPAIEHVYGVVPAAFKALVIGDQYHALDVGDVQAADVATTDGELTSGNYTLLRDPRHVFGWGEAVPVVPVKVLEAEGPAFAATINRVSALLSTPVMRQLNAAVDISGQSPETVAKQFLFEQGLLPATQS